MANLPDNFVFPGQHMQTLETFSAEKVLLYVQDVLHDYPALAMNSKFEAIRQAHIDNLVMRITTWCVSGRIKDTVTTHKVSYPDGVWQMFKENYLPWWFKEKFPVRMKTIEVKETVNHYFVCPHLVTDTQDQHVQFMATGTRLAGRMRP